MTTTEKLARFLEECTWQSRTSPWAQLKSFAWGFCLVLTGNVTIAAMGSIVGWIGLIASFALLFLLTRYTERLLAFSERLRTRKLIEAELHQRFESYRFKKLVWVFLGLFTYFISTGNTWPALTPFLYGVLFGLISQLLWLRTGIDEETYQPVGDGSVTLQSSSARPHQPIPSP